MKVKFWGTRGSLPQPTNQDEFLSVLDGLIAKSKSMGIHGLRTFQMALKNGQIESPVVFGGNTTCTEIQCGERFFFVDMGSGLREAGSFYIPKGHKEFHIFLTHMHWDHIMGLPFFVPVHVPGCKTYIYHVHKNAPEHVKINFNGINFPLNYSQLAGAIEFVQLKLHQPFSIADATVTPFALDHPGGSFGFRFDRNGKSVAIGVDGEYKRISRKDLGPDLQFYQNLDLLVFDAQYEISELISRFDWGHSSPTIGIDLAIREGIRAIALTHHDPWSSPVKLRRMLGEAEAHLKSQISTYSAEWSARGQPDGPKIFNAYDGLLYDV